MLSKSDDRQRALRVPTHEEIAIRAYHLWEARGRPCGSPCEDWFRAEWELRARHGLA